MKVFFYGLFMDEDLLVELGITPSYPVVGCVSGFELHIGERATLLPRSEAAAYGVAMDLDPAESKRLYSEDSVSDYRPEM